jgi:hypothetical protein
VALTGCFPRKATQKKRLGLWLLCWIILQSDKEVVLEVLEALEALEELEALEAGETSRGNNP